MERVSLDAADRPRVLWHPETTSTTLQGHRLSLELHFGSVGASLMRPPKVSLWWLKPKKKSSGPRGLHVTRPGPAESNDIRNFKDLEEMLGNGKTLKRHNQECKGILMLGKVAAST